MSKQKSVRPSQWVLVYVDKMTMTMKSPQLFVDPGEAAEFAAKYELTGVQIYERTVR